jgi:hypothetical protein
MRISWFVVLGGLVILILLVFYVQKTPVVDSFTSWQDTVDYTKSVFNPLAVTTDIRRPNVAGTDDPAAIADFNARVADATRGPLILPGVGDTPVNIDGSGTGLGAYSMPSPLEIPQNSDAMAKVRLCAKVTNCQQLGDPAYAECGFCVKGGSDVPGKFPGTYTGGLYISKSDKADYDAAGKPYLPTFGSCPPRADGTQLFFTGVAPCTRESNRQLCRDVGGFNSPNASKCALSQPTNTFVYQDPANPSFPVFLRVTSPGNTRTTVEILTMNDISLGKGTVDQNGDAVVSVSGVTEGQPVKVVFNQPDSQGSRRAIAAQWEGGTNLKVAFDRTLANIQVGDSMKSLSGRLRKFGSARSSTLMTFAKSSLGSSDAVWIWGANAAQSGFIVQSFIPGLFADPTYAEDKGLQGTLPLIGKADTAVAMQAGACNKPGQSSGRYSVDCLLELYASAGGDPINGGLVKSGLSQLNSMFTNTDAISGYLADLYTRATTGKDPNGAAASFDDINDASKKMFGFEIASKCELVVQNDDGVMGFVPKTAPLPEDCLKYLWENTGNERSRGNEDGRRSSKLQNTYQSIQDRYSGLMTGESTAAKRAQYPFETCQSTGTASPFNAKGAPNWDAIQSVRDMSVGMVQDYYNTIFKTANYTKGNGTDAKSDAQAMALTQCYGVSKVPDTPCA